MSDELERQIRLESECFNAMLAENERKYLDGVRIPEGVTIRLTCVSCPEQYDVTIGDRPLGYIRFRSGHLTAEYPDVGGERVWEEIWWDPADRNRSEWDTQAERAQTLSDILAVLVARHLRKLSGIRRAGEWI